MGNRVGVDGESVGMASYIVISFQEPSPNWRYLVGVSEIRDLLLFAGFLSKDHTKMDVRCHQAIVRAGHYSVVGDKEAQM